MKSIADQSSGIRIPYSQTSEVNHRIADRALLLHLICCSKNGRPGPCCGFDDLLESHQTVVIQPSFQGCSQAAYNYRQLDLAQREEPRLGINVYPSGRP
jgi:hypothetical protein